MRTRHIKLDFKLYQDGKYPNSFTEQSECLLHLFSTFTNLTTSGVCLNSSTSEKKYITVTKHGFSEDVGDIVRHLHRSGRGIAEVAKVFGQSDIALAELINSCLSYAHDTFSEPSQAAIRPFRALTSALDKLPGGSIRLDTPFNGRCEGILVEVEMLRVLSD